LLEEISHRQTDHHAYKNYLYDLDAFVFEAILNCNRDESKIQETISLWIQHYAMVPSQFIVKFHDLVHPRIVDQMLISGQLNESQHRACEYITGYPCNLYFGNNSPFLN
jgi:hypothetical protein